MYLAMQRRCVLEEWQALRGTQSWRWMILPFFAVLPQAKIIFLFQAQTLLDALSLSLSTLLPFLSFSSFLLVSVSPFRLNPVRLLYASRWPFDPFSSENLPFKLINNCFTLNTRHNLWATHHRPTPQYFHQSSPFVGVSPFYLSPSLHLVDCQVPHSSIPILPNVCQCTATGDRRWRGGKRWKRAEKKNSLKPNNG